MSENNIDFNLLIDFLIKNMELLTHQQLEDLECAARVELYERAGLDDD